MSADELPELEPSEPEGFHAKATKLLQDWLNEDSERPRLVDVAVVVWETMTMDEDGDVGRQVNYATLTENAGLASTMGLLSLGQDVLHGDLFGEDGE